MIPTYLEKYGTPKSPEELAKHNCVQFLLSDHATEWTFKKDGRSVAISIDGRYKVGSSLAVRDALRNGFGLSLIPLMYVKEDLKTGRLQTVLDDWAPNESILYVVYPSRRYVVQKYARLLIFSLTNSTKGNNKFQITALG